MNPDVFGIRRQRTEVTDVAAEHVATWFGDGDHERVDSRAPVRLGSERRRPSGEAFGYALEDLAGLQEAVYVRICALLSGQALDEHDRGHHWWPEPLPAEGLDPRECLGIAASKTSHAARVQDEDAQTAFLLRWRPLISAARRLARAAV